MKYFNSCLVLYFLVSKQSDENKVKLTHVPGAVLCQYVDKQTPTEVDYEIGEEKIESAPSSPDTDSINISSDSDTSSSETEPEPMKQSTKQTKTRPSTAKSKRGEKVIAKDSVKSNKDDGTSGRKREINEKDHEDDIGSDANEAPAQYSGSNMCSSSSNELMSNVDRSDAKRCIIYTINSYGDERFPSQGVNYSNMDENARIEDSVATEILNKTLEYEEKELYRQIDVVTSHASRVDNQTNAIIEQISDELQHECTLPEVSRILEAHVEDVEQRWRTQLYENYVPSPDDSIADDEEATLIPSHNSSALEDTFTEDNGEDRPVTEANDSVICNEYIDIDKVINRIDIDKITKESDDSNDVFTDKASDENKNTKDQLNELDKRSKEHRDNKDKGSNDDKGTKETEQNTKSIEVRANISADDEIFEDCVDEIDAINAGNEKDKNFKRVEENYTLEMKLALGISKDE